MAENHLNGDDENLPRSPHGVNTNEAGAAGVRHARPPESQDPFLVFSNFYRLGSVRTIHAFLKQKKPLQ